MTPRWPTRPTTAEELEALGEDLRDQVDDDGAERLADDAERTFWND